MADRDLSPSHRLASSHSCHNATYLPLLLPANFLSCCHPLASLPANCLSHCQSLNSLPAATNHKASHLSCCQPPWWKVSVKTTADSDVRVCQVGTWNLALLVVDKLQLLFLGGELSPQWIILSAMNYLLQCNLAGAWCSVSSPSGSLWNWMHALSRLGS